MFVGEHSSVRGIVEVESGCDYPDCGSEYYSDCNDGFPVEARCFSAWGY